MKKTDAAAARRAGWPFGRSRKTHSASAKTSRSAMPLVARWVNSTIVSRAGARGTTSPLQRGQWAPQPAPEPVARTKAPHRMTATFQPRTSQANRARRVMTPPFELPSIAAPPSTVAGVSASSFSYQVFFRIQPVTSRTSAEIQRPRMSRRTM